MARLNRTRQAHPTEPTEGGLPLSKFTIGLKIQTYNHKLRQARINSGYSLREFSEIIGVSYMTYNSYETMRKYPCYENIMKICEILNISPEETFPNFIKKINKKILKNYEIKRQVYYSEDGINHIEDETENLSIALNKAMDSLDDKEKKVLQMRFLNNKKLDEVGAELKISRTRVQQIESKALRKLRHPTRAIELKEFL